MDRRVTKTKAAIEKAFLLLLLDSGFDAISVKDIADAANISRKTFYLHFVDKYDLLGSLVNKHLTALANICKKRKAPGCNEESFEWFRYIDEHKVFFAALFSVENAVFFRYRFADFLANGLSNRLMSIQEDTASKEVLIRFASNAMLGVVEAYVTGQMKADCEQVTRYAGELWEHLIARALSEQ